MKVIAIILSYIVAFLLGAFVESKARISMQPLTDKSAYQLPLELPFDEKDLRKRIFINAVEKQFLEEIQKRKYFPSSEKE